MINEVLNAPEEGFTVEGTEVGFLCLVNHLQYSDGAVVMPR